MRRLLKQSIAGLAFCAAWISPAPSQAAINISFSSSVPAGFQQEFISNTTGQYLSTLIPSPFFSNTYSLIIKGNNPAYIPPVISSPIATATAVDQLIGYGFANGMDSERYQEINLIRGTQGAEFAAGTCAGDYIGFSSSTVSVSTMTAFYQCLNAYNVMVSTIQQRWQYIYDPKGNQVGP